ncbi:MAG: hypothetical protein V8R89_05490 [Alphaproteobacteria bacterium]
MKSLPVLLMAALLPNAAAAETIDVRSDSEQPTVIYGEAENANGTFNEMTVEQAADAQNPFGNPIVNKLPYGKPAPEVEKGKPLPPAPELGKSPVNVVSQTSGQNPEISPQNSPEQMQNEIQNTLYELDDRIYDLQSYPDNDINQIENRGNAVTNYPEY